MHTLGERKSAKYRRMLESQRYHESHTHTHTRKSKSLILVVSFSFLLYFKRKGKSTAYLKRQYSTNIVYQIIRHSTITILTSKNSLSLSLSLSHCSAFGYIAYSFEAFKASSARGHCALITSMLIKVCSISAWKITT